MFMQTLSISLLTLTGVFTNDIADADPDAPADDVKDATDTADADGIVLSSRQMDIVCSTWLLSSVFGDTSLLLLQYETLSIWQSSSHITVVAEEDEEEVEDIIGVSVSHLCLE